MFGEFVIQRIAAIAGEAYSSDYKGRIVIDQADDMPYFGDDVNNDWRTLNDVPYGSLFFFESDTAHTGYSLLTSINERLLYVTQGSVAGGESGGSAKSGCTWTQPVHTHTQSHTHTVSSHTHGLGSHTHSQSHNHQWHEYISSNISYSFDSGGSAILWTSYGTYGSGNGVNVDEQNTDNWFPPGDFYTESDSGTTGAAAGNTGSDSPGTSASSQASTGAVTAGSSWRPVGRNLTMQQRI
jgi:hypothetical protein